MTIAAGQTASAADLLAEHNADGTHKTSSAYTTNHTALSNKGTNTHAQIDAFIAAVSAPQSAQITADVTMTNANQFYDGASKALTVGTWLVIAGICVLTGNNTPNVTAKLWNGTTVAAEDSLSLVAYGHGSITLSGIAVLTGNETWKISAASTEAAGTIKATVPSNGAANKAGWIVAVKLA